MLLFTYYYYILIEKKILSKCVVAFLMISIILIFVIVGGTILMVKSVLTSQQNSNSMEIGDDNLPVSVLLPLSPYVYSVTIMLLNPGYESAVLYISRIKPSKMTNYLSKVTIPKLSGRSRYNYNYYGADQPIYLISNSRLLYDLIISADTVSKCYARLYLFSDDTNYNNFKNYQVFKSPKAYISSCFQVNKLNTETKIMWAFNITEPSLYYVGVEIDAGVTVTSNISVLRMSYNTTGLSTPNECSEPLSSVNPSCTLILCSSNFICSKLMSCILVKPTGIVKITYTSVSAHIHGQSGVLGFSFSLVMFFIALLAFVTLIFLSLHYRSVIVSHLCLCRY